MNAENEEIQVKNKHVYGQRTIFLAGRPEFIALEGMFVEQTMNYMDKFYNALVSKDLYNSKLDDVKIDTFFYELKPSKNLTILVYPVKNGSDIAGQNIEFRVYNTKMNENFSEFQVVEQTELILNDAEKYLRKLHETCCE